MSEAPSLVRRRLGKGYFEAADGGTLFLDEVGELPLATQVKLLRVIQEGEVSRLGSSTATKVDVRIIAATNRELTSEVVAGRFREDLFFRLAVGVLHLPALRDRQGDLSLLIDHGLETANAEAGVEPGFVPKQLSAAARQVFLEPYLAWKHARTAQHDSSRCAVGRGR